MTFKRCLIPLILFLLLASASAEEATLSFPCDAELSPFLSVSEHKITQEFDLNLWHRMRIDYWGDEPVMVESGSLIILDDQFMMINLRFSKDFDYEAHERAVPEEIILTNHDLNEINDTNPPEWRVMMYPDKDDPYSFHYIGTWNRTMYAIYFEGYAMTPEGSREVFSSRVEM